MSEPDRARGSNGRNGRGRLGPRAGNTRSPGKPPGPRTDWGAVADWYDELVGDAGSEYQREVVFPGVLKMLALSPGERVLDVACGQGVLCRLMHERGAQATGIDAADQLIRIAHKRSDPAIQLLRGDAREIERNAALADASFDAATCVLAIGNIDPIAPVFAGVRRVLRDGGRFVLAMMHPSFRGPKATHWGWDDAAGVQFRRVDRYLLPHKQPIVTHPGRDATRYTWTFHRPLQSYFKALHDAGFIVSNLQEWASHKHSDSSPRAKAENRARREIPMFLALTAIKTGSG